MPNDLILPAQKQVGRLIQVIQYVLHNLDLAGRLQLGQLHQFFSASPAGTGFPPGASVWSIFVCGTSSADSLWTKTFKIHKESPLK